VGEDRALFDVPPSRWSRLRNAAGLTPVQHRNRWVGWGLVVQLVAVALPIAWVVVRAKHEAVAGLALRSTVSVTARESLHTPVGLLILGWSAVVFALGSMLVARPFVRSLGMLAVAVPLAAFVGVLILGALAFVVALVIALAWAGVDLPGGSRRGANKPGPAKKPHNQHPR
jgi:hypothetical protein